MTWHLLGVRAYSSRHLLGAVSHRIYYFDLSMSEDVFVVAVFGWCAMRFVQGLRGCGSDVFIFDVELQTWLAAAVGLPPAPCENSFVWSWCLVCPPCLFNIGRGRAPGTAGFPCWLSSWPEPTVGVTGYTNSCWRDENIASHRSPGLLLTSLFISSVLCVLLHLEGVLFLADLTRPHLQ